MKAFAVLDHRGQQGQVSPDFEFGLQAPSEVVARLCFDWPLAIGTILCAHAGEEQAQKMIDLCDGGDGALAAAPAGALLDADGWRNASNQIHIRTGELLDKLAGISVHRIEKAALSFGKKKVESQGALSGAAHAGNNDKLITRDR